MKEVKLILKVKEVRGSSSKSCPGSRGIGVRARSACRVEDVEVFECKLTESGTEGRSPWKLGPCRSLGASGLTGLPGVVEGKGKGDHSK